MIYSDRDLKNLMDSGELEITPFHPECIQPASYDLHLGNGYIIPGISERDGTVVKRAIEITIAPQEFLLCHTEETVTLSDLIVAEVSGKSTWARRGLGVHVTAGFIDPGFSGQITLEMYNFSQRVLTLVVGQPIAQLVVARLSSPAERPYGSDGLGSKYQGQMGATPAR